MSWSVNAKGTREEVRAEIDKQFYNVHGYYKETPEGADILAIRERAMALIDACDLESEGWAKGDKIEVKAHGSHSMQTTWQKPTSASFSLSVSRVE